MYQDGYVTVKVHKRAKFVAACRQGRKSSRSAAAWSAGSSSGAKWPPRGGSVTRTAFAVRSSQARGGRPMSPGNSEKPDGTSTRRASWAGGIAEFARYIRIDEPIVAVSQYSVTVVRISSLLKRRS